MGHHKEGSFPVDFKTLLLFMLLLIIFFWFIMGGYNTLAENKSNPEK